MRHVVYLRKHHSSSSTMLPLWDNSMVSLIQSLPVLSCFASSRQLFHYWRHLFFFLAQNLFMIIEFKRKAAYEAQYTIHNKDISPILILNFQRHTYFPMSFQSLFTFALFSTLSARCRRQFFRYHFSH